MALIEYEKLKDIFVNVVSTIFQIILFIGNFLGLLYILDGNFAFAFLGSSLLTVLYFFLIQLMVGNKQIMYNNLIRERKFHFSLVLWVFYLGLALMSGYLLTHFVNVEYNAKENIQRSAKRKLEVVSSAIQLYDSVSTTALAKYSADFRVLLYNYKTTGNPSVKSVLVAPPYSLASASISVNETIDLNGLANAHLEPITSKIDTTRNYLAREVEQNNKKHEAIFRNWKRLDLARSYANLNDYVEKSTIVINDKLKELPIMNNPVTFTFDRGLLPIGNPSLLAAQYPPNYSVPLLVIFVIHLFLIIPYFFEQIERYKPKKRKNLDDDIVH